MAYRQFTTDEYEKLRRQHNIMVLVGNGFDIQVTGHSGSRFSPRYLAFYHYLLARDFDSSNVVVKQMAAAKASRDENWSDIEAAIERLVAPSGGTPAEEVYKATTAIQAVFSEYLDLVAPPDVLVALGKESAENSLGVCSVGKFVGDAAEKSENFEFFKFPQATCHYDLFNYLFINFNYTQLLDDYVFRDSQQFDPHRYKNADRHFDFFPNPTGHDQGCWNAETSWSSYLRSEVVHPHGQQSIPRSLLFGIDAPDDLDRGSDYRRKLMKPYWAMNDIEYKHLFRDTRLFIIFGCSLGASDGWWWRRIYAALQSPDSAGVSSTELIIYWWCPVNDIKSRDDILRIFFERCSGSQDLAENSKIEGQVQVIVYTDDDPPVFLRNA